MIGTAFTKVKEKLTCLDEQCRGVLDSDDGSIVVGVFTDGELRNVRCPRCRGPIKEKINMKEVVWELS